RASRLLTGLPSLSSVLGSRRIVLLWASSSGSRSGASLPGRRRTGRRQVVAWLRCRASSKRERASGLSLPGHKNGFQSSAHQVEPNLLRAGVASVSASWRRNSERLWDHRRSFRLADLAPLAAVPGVSLVSLQKGTGVEQLAGAAFPVVDLGKPNADGNL